MNKIGVVAIGRNEGERLVRCLESVLAQLPDSTTVVYVDSGSTDDSCEVARARGIEVVNLDMSIPFTASRARNAGFERLREQVPQVKYVQFIDGDSQLVEGWFATVIDTFERHPEVVAVCGWRSERAPELSLYNRIAHMEGRMVGPVGIVRYFEGNVVILADAFAAVGGYNNNVIAAEDDELSIRLRQAGGTLLRLDQESIIHDADMHTVFQWWRRSKRTGYAFAQVSYLHGAPPERKFVKEIRRTWLWGAVVPVGAIALAPMTYGLSLIVLVRYPLTVARLFYQTRTQKFPWQHCLAWALSCTMATFPGVMGASKFYFDRLRGKQPEIIEYKGLHTPATSTTRSTRRSANG